MYNIECKTIEDATHYWIETQLDSIDADMLKDLDDAYGNVVLLAGEPEYDKFPMWGTMWSFKDSCDTQWLIDNSDKMAELGFSIYDTPYGYFFGIDGAGYDFFFQHWIPLYKARGLRWHSVNE